MPDLRGLLRRWERSKPAEPAATEVEVSPEGEQPAPPDLPPVEELEAGSDFAAFLRPEVSAALRRAALRQAWKVTPAIAGHKPLVDYDWDFNAPGAHDLKAVDDPARLIARLFASRRSDEARATSAPDRSNDEADVQPGDAAAPERDGPEDPQVPIAAAGAEEQRAAGFVELRHRPLPEES